VEESRIRVHPVLSEVERLVSFCLTARSPKEFGGQGNGLLQKFTLRKGLAEERMLTKTPLRNLRQKICRNPVILSKKSVSSVKSVVKFSSRLGTFVANIFLLTFV
jgi:hypothetical protein